MLSAVYHEFFTIDVNVHFPEGKTWKDELTSERSPAANADKDEGYNEHFQ